jgi:hypothetical protein
MLIDRVDLDPEHVLEVYKVAATSDQYWAAVVHKKTGHRIGDHLLISTTSLAVAIRELSADAREALGSS